MRALTTRTVNVDAEVPSAIAVRVLPSSPSQPSISLGPPVSVADSTICLGTLVSQGAGVLNQPQRALSHSLGLVFSSVIIWWVGQLGCSPTTTQLWRTFATREVFSILLCTIMHNFFCVGQSLDISIVPLFIIGACIVLADSESPGSGPQIGMDLSSEMVNELGV